MTENNTNVGKGYFQCHPSSIAFLLVFVLMLTCRPNQGPVLQALLSFSQSFRHFTGSKFHSVQVYRYYPVFMIKNVHNPCLHRIFFQLANHLRYHGTYIGKKFSIAKFCKNVNVTLQYFQYGLFENRNLSTILHIAEMKGARV